MEASCLPNLRPGDRVVYHRTQRGGYGFVVAYEAVVVRTTAHRVVVRYTNTRGVEFTRTVPPESLSWPSK